MSLQTEERSALWSGLLLSLFVFTVTIAFAVDYITEAVFLALPLGMCLYLKTSETSQIISHILGIIFLTLAFFVAKWSFSKLMLFQPKLASFQGHSLVELLAFLIMLVFGPVLLLDLGARFAVRYNSPNS